MKKLVFAFMFLFMSSAFIITHNNNKVEIKETKIKIEKSNMVPKKKEKDVKKWRAWATLKVQRADGQIREIEGKASVNCKNNIGIGTGGGYDYEKDAKDAAKKDADRQIKADEKEIKCTYRALQDCVE